MPLLDMPLILIPIFFSILGIFLGLVFNNAIFAWIGGLNLVTAAVIWWAGEMKL